VQVHGAPAEAAVAGQRTALNLAGVSTEDLARGMTLATADTFRSTSRVDALLSLLPSAKPLKDGARVHFHAYTTEMIAEARLHGAKQLKPGDEAYAQLRFAEPMLLLPGDRFIVRQFSPVVTIGGGVVLDASPAARNSAQKIRPPFSGSCAMVLLHRYWQRAWHGAESSVCAWLMFGEMNIWWGDAAKLAAAAGLVWCNRVLVAPAAFAEAKADVLQALKKFHDANPLVAGMSKEELRDRVNLGPEVFYSVLEKLTEEKKLEIAGELVHLPGAEWS